MRAEADNYYLALSKSEVAHWTRRTDVDLLWLVHLDFTLLSNQILVLKKLKSQNPFIRKLLQFGFDNRGIRVRRVLSGRTDKESIIWTCG